MSGHELFEVLRFWNEIPSFQSVSLMSQIIQHPFSPFFFVVLVKIFFLLIT